MAEDEVGDSRMRVGGWLPPLRPVRPAEPGHDRRGDADDLDWRDFVGGTSEPRHHVGAAHRRPRTTFQDVSLRLFLLSAGGLSLVVILISYLLVRPEQQVGGPPIGGVGGVFDPTTPTRRWTDGPPWTTGPASPTVTSPTAAPTSVSPTPARPSRTTVRPKPPPKPATVVELRRLAVPSTVDLTVLGRLDWVHWGQFGARSVERKDNGTGAIIDQGGTPRGSYDNNPERFAWRDGQRNEYERGTRTGVYTCGRGGSFNLAVRMSAGKRTVRLFAGAWMARGRLDVRLSTGGPVRTATLENRYGISTAQFDVTVVAPAGAHLLLRWSTEESFHRDCGNVDLQALALS